MVSVGTSRRGTPRERCNTLWEHLVQYMEDVPKLPEDGMMQVFGFAIAI